MARPGSSSAAPALAALAACLLANAASAQSSPAGSTVQEPVVNAPLPDGDWELGFGFGFARTSRDSSVVPTLSVVYAVTDRLSWKALLAAAYRWGEPGVAELSTRAGLQSIGHDDELGWIGNTDAGVTGQLWLTPRVSLLAEVTALWRFETLRRADQASTTDQLTLEANVGSSWQPIRFLTVSFAAGMVEDLQIHHAPVEYGRLHELAFGSLQGPGYRDLPLLRVHITPRVTFDLHTHWGFSLRRRYSHREQYAVGFTFLL